MPAAPAMRRSSCVLGMAMVAADARAYLLSVLLDQYAGLCSEPAHGAVLCGRRHAPRPHQLHHRWAGSGPGLIGGDWTGVCLQAWALQDEGVGGCTSLPHLWLLQVPIGMTTAAVFSLDAALQVAPRMTCVLQGAAARLATT